MIFAPARHKLSIILRLRHAAIILTPVLMNAAKSSMTAFYLSIGT
jgi:hypothetical protein